MIIYDPVYLYDILQILIKKILIYYYINSYSLTGL